MNSFLFKIFFLREKDLLISLRAYVQAITLAQT